MGNNPLDQLNAIDLYKFKTWLENHNLSMAYNDLLLGHLGLLTTAGITVTNCKECKYYLGHAQTCAIGLLGKYNGLCLLGEKK